MSQASITPFAAVALPARAPATHIPNTLSALDDVQQELDELLLLLDCGRQAREDLTRCRIFRRSLERATDLVEQLREQMRGVGHE